MIRAWVKYGCGCQEGIWVDDGKVCDAYDREGRHNHPVVAYSDKVTLCPKDKDWIPMETSGGN